MIPKSIKWRLQLWYGLILLAVLGGFGTTAYQLERNRVFHRIDDELHRRTAMLAQALHRPPRRATGGFEGNDGPPPDFGPGEGEPQNNPPKFILPPRVAGLFDTNEGNGNFFFRITRAVETGHDEIARSDNYGSSAESTAEHYISSAQQFRQDDWGKIQATPPQSRDFGSERVVMDILPSGEEIEVGCNVGTDRRELKMTALRLAGFGGAILVLGLAGGWWFVGRALRPIAEISATAAKISTGDLTQRINSRETGSELGQLAAVLNSTFARLERAFAQQKQFASDAAHELRTPVAVILTQTQMALARERDAAAYRVTLEACQRAAQRMRRLIESLLELARFDAGQETLKRLNFDLARTVEDCIELVQPLAAERQVKLTRAITQVSIMGDVERIGQVVTNLLTNAIQYNIPDGEVRVKLRQQGGVALLEMSDTGRGISAEDLPRVFERFYRADSARTGAGNAGLGLSICKSIVEAHGGTIEASSEEGKGATFEIRLPVGA